MAKSQGYRGKFTRVKTAKGRKNSSTNWLKRQLNDPYVAKAKIDGYRSRAAYKLIEINEKFKLFKPGQNIVDLGAAPGGWSQVAINLTKAKSKTNAGKVIAIDLLDIDQMNDLEFLKADFNLDSTKDFILEKLEGRLADIVISDMAANTTGHGPTDHIRILDLCENAFHFALKILAPQGHFIAKIFKGGADSELLNLAKQHFSKVKHFKPSSSRKDSSEFYLIAMERKTDI